MTFRAVLLVLALGVDTTGAFHTPLTAGSGRAGRAGTSVKSTKDGLESAGVAALSLLDEQKEKVTYAAVPPPARIGF